MDAGRVSPLFGPIDFPFDSVANLNRAGLEYQGDWQPRSWAHTTVGYRFEDENGFVGDLTALPLSHGLRLNHSVYGQEALSLGRFSLIGGLRFEHNGSFGNKAVPRVAASYLVRRGNERLAATRLRFSYAQGILEPTLEESFGVGGFGIVPNPGLKAEQNRAFEAGFDQSFGSRGRYAVSGTYFNNLFTDQIAFSFDPVTFVSQYVNVNKALAHGAELELQRVRGREFPSTVATRICRRRFLISRLPATRCLNREDRCSSSETFGKLVDFLPGDSAGERISPRPR